MNGLAQVVEEVTHDRDTTEILQDDDEQGDDQRCTDNPTETGEDATNERAPDLATGGADKVDVVFDHELFHGLAQLFVVDPTGANLWLGLRVAEHLALASLVILKTLGLVFGRTDEVLSDTLELVHDR